MVSDGPQIPTDRLLVHFRNDRVRRRPLFLQSRGHCFRLLHHAQHVQAGKLFQFVVRVSAADQLFEELRIVGDAFESGRRRGDAVEVAADADVIGAGDLHDVLDVIGNVGDRRARCGVRGVPLRERVLHFHRIAAE